MRCLWLLLLPVLAFGQMHEILRPTVDIDGGSAVSIAVYSQCGIGGTLQNGSIAQPNWWDNAGLSTSSVLSQTNGSSVGGRCSNRVFKSWPSSLNTYTALTLNINTSGACSTNDCGVGIVAYSLNAGSTWTNVQSTSGWTQVTNTITLSTSQVLGNIWVVGNDYANPKDIDGGSFAITGFDVWTDGTYIPPTPTPTPVTVPVLPSVPQPTIISKHWIWPLWALLLPLIGILLRVKNMKRFLCLLILAIPLLASGQNARFDSVALTTKGVQGQQVSAPVSTAVITVCTSGATGIPCSPQVTTYNGPTTGTACPGSTQVTLTGSSLCQSTGDTLGNFGFWVPPGNYTYSVSGPGVTPQLYSITLPIISGGTASLGSVTATVLSGPFNGSPWIDPTAPAYGAKCDWNGTTGTDDTTALQAAINAAIAAGKPLFIPGKCRFTTTLNMNINAAPVKIIGGNEVGVSSAVASLLEFDPPVGNTSAMLYKNLVGNQFIFFPRWSGVALQCNRAAGCGKAIEAYILSEAFFRDLGILGGNGFFSTGMFCSGCNIMVMDHPVLNGFSSGNSPTLGLDCVNCSAFSVHDGDLFYFTLATMRFSGSGTVQIGIHDNWFESQDIAILIDDTVNVTGTDSFAVYDNRFLFNNGNGVVQGGGAFANQIVMKYNNTGTNTISAFSTQFGPGNSAQCSITLCSAAYPIILNYSATTGAQSHLEVNVFGDEFRGFSTGMLQVVNGPSAAQTRLQFDKDYYVDQSSNVLPNIFTGTATNVSTLDYTGKWTLLNGVSVNGGAAILDSTGKGTFGNGILEGGPVAHLEGAPSGANTNTDTCQGSSTTHGLMCSYNNDAFGLVLRANAATSQKAETQAADANVLTYTPPALVGTYRVCTAISVTSATTGVISWTLSWTDSSGNAQANIAQPLFQFGTAAPNTTFTASAAGNYEGCSMIDVNAAAASIIVKWLGGGTTVAKMSATIERLQ